MAPENLRLEVGASTRLGQKRQHLQQGHFVDAARGVFAVVRGYGGQQSGNVAVDAVCDELGTALRAESDLVAAVRRAFAAASARLRAAPADQGDRFAGVTTLVVAPPRATVVHVGGGRAYLVRAAAARQLTEDHTQELELGIDRLRKLVLTRALNGEGDAQVVDTIVDADDRFVLVSDVVARAVPPLELAAVVCGSHARAAADRLTELAHRRIEDDSATAVVVAIDRMGERL